MQLFGHQIAGRHHQIGGERAVIVVVAVAERRGRAELADGDVPRRAVRIDEIPVEGEIAPHRLRAVGIAAPVPGGPQPVDVGVVQEEDRVARRQIDHRHVAADRLVHAVVRIELELGLGAEPALPRRRRAVLAARPRRAERLEVRAVHDPRDHRLADHVLGEPQAAGDAGPRVKQRVGVAVAGRERRRELPVRGPVPVRQREVALARQLLADALEGEDVGAMPRQEVPVAVRTEIAMDVGEADPVARIGLRQRLHRGDRAAHRGEIGIVGGHAADGAPRDARALRAERRIAAEHRKRRTAGDQKRASVEHEKPHPLDGEEVSNMRRQTNSSPARLFPRVVIASG